MEELAEAGHRRARGLLVALRQLSFQLSGAQLGITVTSLLVGFIVEPTIGESLAPVVQRLGLPEESAGGVSVTLALIFATAVQMVLGELIPKNLAVAKPLGVGFSVVNPLRFLNAAFRPLIRFLNASANATVRLLGIEPTEELSGVRSLDELELLIRSSRQEGVLPEEEASFLARSITFRDKTAADILMPRTSMVVLARDDTVSGMVERALETGHSRFPVTGEGLDDIAGIAHVKDVLRTPPTERATTPVTEIMQESFFVPESRHLPPLLSEMRRERKHLAVVLDEYGGTAGIVTLEDLLEEIVGAIEDEHDTAAAAQEEPRPAGPQMLSGLLHRDEVAELAGLELPEGDYDTLAGFMLAQLDRVPEEPGARVSFEGWSLEVTEMDKRRIAEIRAVPPPPQAGEQEDAGS